MEEVKKTSVKKNYVYNLIYQLVLLIVPFAVTPYLSRVLGSDGTGQYGFTFSIVTYFTLVGALGFNIYGQRVIAKYQDNHEQQKKVFWECVIARLLPVLFVLLVYVILIFCNVYSERYTLLMLILGINVVAVAFDIAFYFQGNELFSKIVTVNVVIKLLGIAGIFIFVKTKDDVWLYTLLQSATVILSNLAIWLFLPRDIFKIDLKSLHPLSHMKPTILLFLPTIAISVYTSLDKTMIGLITGNDSENGNYEYAEKIVKMGLTLLTSLGTVMVSHNAKKFADGDNEGVINNIYKSSSFVWLLGIPLMFGLICVADNLIPWYLGADFDKAANLMKIMSPLVLFIGFSNLFGVQYFVAKGEDKKFTIAILVGAVTNFSLNAVLIFYFKSYGAAIATVIAELLVTIVDLFFMRKFFSIKKMLLSSVKYWISGMIMFVPCYFLSTLLQPSILNTCIITFTGVMVYGVMVLLLRDKFLCDNISILINKLKSKKKAKL